VSRTKTSSATLRPPFPSDRYTTERLGEERPAGAALYIWRVVARQLVEIALHYPDRTQFCLLTGRHSDGPGSPYVEIVGFADLCTTTKVERLIVDLAEDWELTVNRMTRAAPQLEIVGWAGFRPGGNAGLNPYDELVHRSLFNLPHHVSLQLDPVTRTFGAYGVDSTGYLINVGINVIDRRAAPSTHSSSRTSTPQSALRPT